MKKSFSKYIIVGAGLSGLTAAYQLFKSGEKDVIVLESRDRIGGRIMTDGGIDFGATWFQEHHENTKNILEELGIAKFYQYSKGRSVLVYSSMAPEHYFENDPNAPSAYRIAQNSIAMVRALAAPFKNRIITSTSVLEIQEAEDVLSVRTDKGLFTAEKVVVTVPPRIATRIQYTPALPEELTTTMKKTHTWMSNAIKVGLTFKAPFWRAKNLSGMLIGQIGAVTELYDHCNAEDDSFALMGFVNEALRDVSAKERKERILTYLAKYLGKEVLQYTTYNEKDWSQDRNTSCASIKSVYMSPSYGNPIFAHAYMKKRLYFAGAETSPMYGGYMDGAIYSGLRTAEKLVPQVKA